MDDMLKQISAFVRMQRAKKQLNQKELSDLSGVSTRAISALENNRFIARENMDAIFQALGFKAKFNVEFEPMDSLDSNDTN